MFQIHALCSIRCLQARKPSTGFRGPTSRPVSPSASLLRPSFEISLRTARPSLPSCTHRCTSLLQSTCERRRASARARRRRNAYVNRRVNSSRINSKPTQQWCGWLDRKGENDGCERRSGKKGNSGCASSSFRRRYLWQGWMVQTCAVGDGVPMTNDVDGPERLGMS